MGKSDEEYIKKRVGQILSQRRNNLTQEKLAERADISEKTISNIENGNVLLNIITLIKLCNALKITPNDILGEFIEEDIMEKYNKLNIDTLKFSTREKDILIDFVDFINGYYKD